MSGKTYSMMNSADLTAAFLVIVQSSHSSAEIDRRLHDELGYPTEEVTFLSGPPPQGFLAFMTDTGQPIAAVEFLGPMGNTLSV